ncbi:hypothetical protein [Cohnella sp. WQ 127256]|nr:hypothetical protein [Cohnella sp. WQ 127256]
MMFLRLPQRVELRNLFVRKHTIVQLQFIDFRLREFYIGGLTYRLQ